MKLTRSDLDKKYRKMPNESSISQLKEKDKITYTIKFIHDNLSLATRQAISYKLALREAEQWVLSGNGYTSKIEWEAITGTKLLELDYHTVRQQRKARIAYRQTIKNNQFQNPYVTL